MPKKSYIVEFNIPIRVVVDVEDPKLRNEKEYEKVCLVARNEVIKEVPEFLLAEDVSDVSEDVICPYNKRSDKRNLFMKKEDFVNAYKDRLVLFFADNEVDVTYELNYPGDEDISNHYMSKGYEIASIFDVYGEDHVKLDNYLGYGFHKTGYMVLKPKRTKKSKS